MEGIIYLNFEFADFIVREMIEDGVFEDPEILIGDSIYVTERECASWLKDSAIVRTKNVDMFLMHLEFVYDVDIHNENKVYVSSLNK